VPTSSIHPASSFHEYSATPTASILLAVNGIEVIYNRVILVLKGVSLAVPEGRHRCHPGANGAGKTTTLRAISNLLRGERGEVTKGSVEYRGEKVHRLSPSDLVKRGVIQVMEGRHCFAHLTVEENLLTGAYTQRRRPTRPRLERSMPISAPQTRKSQVGYTSAATETTAVGRALKCRGNMILLDSRRWAWHRRSWKKYSRSCAT
jgi:branched-chain amino acid transport system ATP-binding protein